MPLILQQDVLNISGSIESIDQILKKELENYPPVRIISTSVLASNGIGCTLLVVIETV
jgi:hypothetical protein